MNTSQIYYNSLITDSVIQHEILCFDMRPFLQGIRDMKTYHNVVKLSLNS